MLIVHNNQHPEPLFKPQLMVRCVPLHVHSYSFAVCFCQFALCQGTHILTKPVQEAQRVKRLQALTRFASKKMSRMGNSGEPWETAVCVRLLHRWLSLVVVVYMVQQYPLSLVSVFGLKGNNQRSLNNRLESLSNKSCITYDLPAGHGWGGGGGVGWCKRKGGKDKKCEG